MNTKDIQRVSAICTPCTPLVVKRLLYHYMSADTPKDTDIDTMSVFFLFTVSSVEDANIG